MPVIKRDKPMVELGGVSLPLNMALIFTAYGSVANRYTTLNRDGLPYQVPVGFELVLVGLRGFSSTANASLMSIYYGDNSVTDSVAAPTNVVSKGWSSGCTEGATGGEYEAPLFARIPAGKYPAALFSNGPGYGSFIGYLVKV